MAPYMQLFTDDLPDLKTIILHPNEDNAQPKAQPRRSPRKNLQTIAETMQDKCSTQTTIHATSSQRQLSPAKKSPTKRSPLKAMPQAKAPVSLLQGAPILPRKATLPHMDLSASAKNRQSSQSAEGSVRLANVDSLLLPLSQMKVRNDTSDGESVEEQVTQKQTRARKPVRSTITEVTGTAAPVVSSLGRLKIASRASRFVLDEAACDEDLVDSDAQDEGEDEDTDLSGFIVDDDAELSYHDSSEDGDSEEERRSRKKVVKTKSRKRLQRGRRWADSSGGEDSASEGLANALGGLQLDAQRKTGKESEVEVIDLTSPEHKPSEDEIQPPSSVIPSLGGTNLFDKFKALKLSPPKSSQPSHIPSKSQRSMSPFLAEKDDEEESRGVKNGFTTPPVTPPQSPTKLRSPTKLMSPSKRGDGLQKSPHRQSMDAFWDLNEVNEWNDQFSPKKAPVTSPRKNRLAAFDLWSDGEEDSFEAMNETSDSLPSPCESPSKSKSRPASPIKAERQRLIAEKKAKELTKKQFESSKEQMATDLLAALDENITQSQISRLSQSTGGVQIIWSKTLRSTAGRANWRRTVTKPTGSPVKGKAEESISGVIVQHFANIELATKVIDREDRLINTLAHEFCHLANFMVSGIRDQPHGASFQKWAQKVTTWMKNQDKNPEWKNVEVTTKHGYVIEWKYLWVCVGRDQNKAMEMLNINEEDGCGAEYGRHSKSIDTDNHRCGRCKGRLVQVRPKPRASPVKKSATSKGIGARRSPVKRNVSSGSEKSSAVLNKLVEIIELSD